LIEHAAHTRLVGGLNPLSATRYCHRGHRHSSGEGFPARDRRDFTGWDIKVLKNPLSAISGVMVFRFEGRGCGKQATSIYD
ncbi:MAG: hypothetical protein PHH75_05825, partial [Candidatus Omnitrophica bacterium]|nr:hypothetical protein [Candidatus Omnitrophota bacterium]